jgi:hypothetical protein
MARRCARATSVWPRSKCFDKRRRKNTRSTITLSSSYKTSPFYSWLEFLFCELYLKIKFKKNNFRVDWIICNRFQRLIFFYFYKIWLGCCKNLRNTQTEKSSVGMFSLISRWCNCTRTLVIVEVSNVFFFIPTQWTVFFCVCTYRKNCCEDVEFRHVSVNRFPSFFPVQSACVIPFFFLISDGILF